MCKEAIIVEENKKLRKKMEKKIHKLEPTLDKRSINLFLDGVFVDCPQELEQNIWEWVENKPYTDIKYCGLSINDLFDMGFDKNHFFTCIDVLNRLNTILHRKYESENIYTLYSTSLYENPKL